MSYMLEGQVVIPLEEFWDFVNQYTPNCTEWAFGVPKVVGDELVIKIAVDSDLHPSDWTEKPECLKEWEK